MMAEIGTPLGSSRCVEIDGHCLAGAVNLELGWAAAEPFCPQGRPCQSTNPSDGAAPNPSHQGSRLAVSATFVNMLFRWNVAMAFGLLLGLVPGTTPKNPASGLIAQSRPSLPI